MKNKFGLTQSLINEISERTTKGKQYSVEWDNGRTLDLMADADVWIKLND